MIDQPAIPRLVGHYETGSESGIRWARWPLEVHSAGCLLRFCLAPVGKWRDYDFLAISATVTPVLGQESQLITVTAGAPIAPPYLGSPLLPALGVEPNAGAPWDHAWMLECWWPREAWGATPITVSWPARQLSVRWSIDPDASPTRWVRPDEQRPHGVRHPNPAEAPDTEAMNTQAIPVLVGELRSGVCDGFAWALWPIEVYSSGATLRLRLIPATVSQIYRDTGAAFATWASVPSAPEQYIRLSAGGTEIPRTRGARTPADAHATPGPTLPWDDTWTLTHWWPRDAWTHNELTLTWPARNLRLQLALDLDALRHAARNQQP